MAIFPEPLYGASKAAISSFVHSLAPLELTHGIRVNAIAPGIVKTRMWLEDQQKQSWVDEEKDAWVESKRIAEVMLELVQKEENVGGTILEVGTETVRKVQLLNDPGPRGKGLGVSNTNVMMEGVLPSIADTFGK